MNKKFFNIIVATRNIVVFKKTKSENKCRYRTKVIAFVKSICDTVRYKFNI